MKSGYRILWTDNALSELSETIEYLEENWTEKEIENFANELEHTIELISKSPEMFQSSKKKKGIRRAVVMNLNSLYYRKRKDSVEILSFFANRKDPNDLKI
jgi:plasmid stabilization system protein ParE